jgi:hypothetical protein
MDLGNDSMQALSCAMTSHTLLQRLHQVVQLYHLIHLWSLGTLKVTQKCWSMQLWGSFSSLHVDTQIASQSSFEGSMVESQLGSGLIAVFHSSGLCNS